MKKFALSILSVMLLFGGFLLTSCQKEISLSVSTQQVVIYTNDEQNENSYHKEIEVKIENSSSGIGVEVLKGEGKISCSTPVGDSAGKYTFDIVGVTSGDAEVKVYARDNPSISKNIYVKVKTLLEHIVKNETHSIDGRELNFVVKSGSFTNKADFIKLDNQDYFDIEPSTANVRDLVWSFDDYDTTTKNYKTRLTVDGTEAGDPYAEIIDGKLYVYENCMADKLTIRAMFKKEDGTIDRSKFNTVELSVLTKSSIKNLTISDSSNTYEVYKDEAVRQNAVHLDLKRKNGNFSLASGEVELISKYDVNLDIDVYKIVDGKHIRLQRDTTAESEGWGDYFSFDVTGSTKTASGATYQFEINAMDSTGIKKYGEFVIYLKLEYADFYYDFMSGNIDEINASSENKSGADIFVTSKYSVESVTVVDSLSNPISNNEVLPINIFSNYEMANGYQMRVLLSPDDVAVDNSSYRIVCDANVNDFGANEFSYFATLYRNGRAMSYTIDGSAYVFEGLLSSDLIEIVSATNEASKLNVRFDFVSNSTGGAKTSLYTNFYRITSGETLEVSNENGTPIEERYISSSTVSTREIEFNLKINGVSTLNGLSLIPTTENSNFVFSKILDVTPVDERENNYIIVNFTVILTQTEIEDSVQFYFQHITGKKSRNFTVRSYVPLTSATVGLADNSSADIFVSDRANQNYIISGTNILLSDKISNETLSRLMLEAGVRLPLEANYRKATLGEGKVQFKVLNIDSNAMLEIVRGLNGNGGKSDDELRAIANQIFATDTQFDGDATNVSSVSGLVRFYASRFEDAQNSGLFTIDENSLEIQNNNTFKCIVLVQFNGFDEKAEDENSPQELSIVRYFALESFFSVKNLSSDVKTMALFTKETLSNEEEYRAIKDVTITLRPDDNTPTYTSLENFTFVSNKVFENGQNRFTPSADRISISNDYYSILNIALSQDKKQLKFRVVANSTKNQTYVNDILTIEYQYGSLNHKTTAIQINIRNVNRVESVKWLNPTRDNEIYLNLSSTDPNERNFTISTSVLPSSADNVGLDYVYVARRGSSSNLKITTSEKGQNFNLNIETYTEGGVGDMYLLPKDMIKNVDGIKQLLYFYYSTDGDGNIIETAKYKPLSEINSFYDDLINGDETKQISNYFLNNDGEKIYYKDFLLKILVTIADGKNRDTAIHVYNEADLKQIDYAKYYRVMNNIELNSWKTLAEREFTGTIYAKEGDDYTITMSGNSYTFVNQLGGTLENLTFVGKIESEYSGDFNTSYGGFVANEVTQTGALKNITIDVHSIVSADESKLYEPSKLTSSAKYVGGIVGKNSGLLENVSALGLSIECDSYGVIGGIAGYNAGQIVGGGVEFYLFGEGVYNTISAQNATIGGLVGFADYNSTISKSYVYAYPCEDTSVSAEKIFDKTPNLSLNVAVFVANLGQESKISESFGFLGEVSATAKATNNSQRLNIENCYVSYVNGSQINVKSYIGSIAFTIGSDVFRTWKTASVDLTGVDTNVWETENIDSSVNFGLPYLKNVQQNVKIDVENVVAGQGENENTLKVDDGKFLFFIRSPKNNVKSNAELSQLNEINTILLSDLFAISGTMISKNQAKSLIVTTDNSEISVLASGIKFNSISTGEFDFEVRSKMDMTKKKTFKAVLTNYLPQLQTSIDGADLREGQTILLQTGASNSRQIIYATNNTISLNGQIYEIEKDEFVVGYEIPSGDEAYLNVQKSAKTLNLVGKDKKDDKIHLTSWASLIKLDDTYNNALKSARKAEFDVSIFEGATAFSIEDATDMSIRPNGCASFNAIVVTDEADGGNIVLDLFNNENSSVVPVDKNIINDYSTEFVVDNDLTLTATWTKTKLADKQYRFNVLVSVNNDCRHKISKNYDSLTISVKPKSQQKSTTFERKINLSVLTQNVEDLSIATYLISSRQVRASTMYYNISSEIAGSLAPASDAIFSVTVSPEYALMTHFNVTYSVEGEGLGMVSLSRLSKNVYGYYVDTQNTYSLSNGISVELTDKDRTGSGVYYFRIYISSEFKANSDLTIKVEFFNKTQSVASGTRSLKIDYLSQANVKVNGSSVVVLAKGTTATVTIRTGLDQNLYNLYLQNSQSNIVLTTPTQTIVDGYKVYTATLSVGITATLSGGKESGIFYVCAQVERVKNNVQEIKESQATICLVDFAINAKDTKVHSSGNTILLNGRTYDAFYVYIGSTDTLLFDYSISPEEYVYDTGDADQVSAVERLLAERKKFELAHTYKDEETSYYVNYKRNDLTGAFEELTLKQQLSYAQNEEQSSGIYNPATGVIASNNAFVFGTDIVGGKEQLTIRGRRSGRQLMKLTTLINYNGIEFEYEYFFVIVVEPVSNEEVPTEISSADEFVNCLKNSEKADDYMLTNDIILDDYEPLDTDKVKSLDGNGYTIYLNSFKMPDTTELNLALFNKVDEITTLKNVVVNIYSGGQIYVNRQKYTTVNVAGFAIENNGIIYNCHVVSKYEENKSRAYFSGENGLAVKFTNGNNTIEENLSSSMGVTSKVSGFVITNNSSIVNSRVGGKSYRHIIDIAGREYARSETLDLFVLNGQGEVSGFVNENTSDANISSCKLDNVQIYNKMNSTNSMTAGFVIRNQSKIQGSYVQGKESFNSVTGERSYAYIGSSIATTGKVAGFVYQNSNLVKNCYTNIAIENENATASLSAGFVYINDEGAEVSLCYSASVVTKNDTNQMQFSGVDESLTSLNHGKISFSYFYNVASVDDTTQKDLTSGVMSISDANDQNVFYGFNFASNSGLYNGIWTFDDNHLTLVSANQEAFTNRYTVTENETKNVFYNRNLIDADTMKYIDLSYGSKNNPIILRNAEDFAKATGKVSDKEISSYKEYYNDTTVFGNYRVVDNIDMSILDIDPKVEAGTIKLTTTKKTFTGVLDGNGFTLSNITLGKIEDVENFGLFAKLDGAVIMNLDLTVASVHNSSANIVGTLAGTAIDSQIVAITLSPIETKDQEITQTSVQGKNIVGGVVGMLFGDSRLSDIKVKDIDIDSSYYNKASATKASGKSANETSIGTNMRRLVMTGIDLTRQVEKISYAGGVAGYIDIYGGATSSEAVKFNGSMRVSEYNVVSVYVDDSVDIYGEVAGGLFGYVGSSTSVYDAKITLNANTAKATPSYIISKNLYAGGIVGENYGGMFGVSASYGDSLQSEIDQNVYNYYNARADLERGQQTIFSYADNTEKDFGTKYNNPEYVGGIAGYMGGGYIYVGYSKLNIMLYPKVSETDKNVAVGGIVGFASESGSESNILGVKDDVKINLYFQDVYATGDVEVYKADGSKSKTYVGGLIGALDNDSKIVLKNALALNNYSGYDDDDFATKHSMILGGLLNESKNYSIYVLRSDQVYTEVSTGKSSDVTEMAMNTVGGYNTIYAGGSAISTIKAFNVPGFVGDYNVPQEDSKRTIEHKVVSKLLISKHIGEYDDLSTAYSEFYNLFLPVGWASEYWDHAEDALYPYITLSPKIYSVYWDNDQNPSDMTADQPKLNAVINAINKNPRVTIIVRGQLLDSNGIDYIYKDIDLRSYAKAKWISDLRDAFANYKGTLIAYNQFMNSSLQGTISRGAEVKRGSEIIGGKEDDDVGIIMNSPLFSSLDGATIDTLSLYMVKNDSLASTDHIDYSLVSGAVQNSIFKNVRVVLNDKVEIESSATYNFSSSGDAYVGGGLITGIAQSSSFVNINVVLRGLIDTISFKTDTDATGGAYFGLIGGAIEQTSAFTAIEVSGLVVERENEFSPDAPIYINYNLGENVKKFHGGLYFGVALKKTTAMFRLGAREQDSNIIYLVGNENENVEATVGGYFGEIQSVSDLILDFDGQKTNEIVLTKSLKSLTAGLVVGSIKNCDKLDISLKSGGVCRVSGGIYQKDNDVSIETVKIGGIVGETNSMLEISSVSTSLDVGRFKTTKDDANEVAVMVSGVTYYRPTYLDDDKVHLFEKNLYNYDDTHPFIVTNNVDNAIGGLVGITTGDEISVLAGCSTTGTIDIQLGSSSANGLISIGGAVGKTTSAKGVTLRGNFENSTNVSVCEKTKGSTANVGGFVGVANSTTTENAKILMNFKEIDDAKNVVTESGRATITQNVVSNVSNFNYGGAVANISNNTFDEASVEICNVIYGGAVKIYGKCTKQSDYTNLTIGGVIGKISAGAIGGEIADESKLYNVANCYSYGDAFMLGKVMGDICEVKTYNFGGIIADACPVKVTNCYSLMTNFNSYLTNDLNNYNVGALVGASADLVTFKETWYSSGVCLAYQTQDNVFDVGYNNSQFLGYSTSANYDASKYNSGRMLEKFSGVVGTGAVGTKLNPLTINSENNTFEVDDLAGKTHNISWVVVAEDFETKKEFVSTLSNAVIVGDGRTVKRIDKETKSTGLAFGGIVGTIGNSDEKNNTVTEATFGAISSLVVDIESTANISVSSAYYGAIAGEMIGNSIVYGVGVNGTASVGGGSQVNFGGLVGNVFGGMINESFVDADLYYRGNDGGQFTGVAYFNNAYNSVLKSTYSAGLMTSYVQYVSIIGLAKSDCSLDGTKLNKLIDCYSYVDTARTNVVTGDPEGKIELTSGYFNEKGQKINGLDGTNATVMSKGLISGGKEVLSETKNTLSLGETSETISKWYYNKYLNNGYSTHGFGYLKNVTVYTRSIKQENYKNLTVLVTGVEENKEEGSKGNYYQYQYTPIAFKDTNFEDDRMIVKLGEVEKEVYIGVQNIGKYKQMIDLISSAEYLNGTLKDENDAQTRKAYRFVIKHDIKLTDSDVDSIAYKDVGKLELEIDANGRTFDASAVTIDKAKPLFNKFTGTLRNIRLINANIKGDSTLADMFDGDLINATVSGNLTPNSAVAGGVVKTLNGNMIAVDGMVSVVSGQKYARIGGLVGEWYGTGERDKILYCSNAGQVVATGAVSTAGGIVGVVSGGGEISYSYNINSVLAGYSGTTDSYYTAGGIVGRVSSYSDELRGGENNGTAKDGTLNIDNCYNTGLVGAGNYNLTNEARAGGIIGAKAVLWKLDSGVIYISPSVDNVTLNVTNSSNDGNVEALSKMSDINVTIKYRLVDGGTEKLDSYSENPSALSYEIYRIYDSSITRRVYAYGLGSGIDNTTGSTSTKSVVKNDGWLSNGETFDGYIKYTETGISSGDNEIVPTYGIYDMAKLTIDRKAILDNEGADGTNFEKIVGKFDATLDKDADGKKPVYCNGYDSYGFPVRVYMADQMLRKFDTDFIKNLDTLSQGDQYPTYRGTLAYMNAGMMDDYRAVLDGDGNKIVDIGKKGSDYREGMKINNTIKNLIESSSSSEEMKQINDEDYIYRFLAKTDYYSSAEFTPYGYVVEQETYLTNNKDTYISAEGVDNCTANIQEIEKKKENKQTSLDVIDIAGTKTSIVRNEVNFTSSISPKTSKITFKFDGLSTEELNNLTSNSVGFSGIFTTYNIDNMTKDESTGSVTYDVTFYYAATISGAQSVTASLKTSKIERIVLQKNNCVGNKLLLSSGTDYGEVSDMSEIKMKIDSTEYLSGLSITKDGEDYYLEGSSVGSLNDGDSVEVSFKYKYKQDLTVEATFSESGSTAHNTNTISATDLSANAHFTNYSKTSGVTYYEGGVVSTSSGKTTILTKDGDDSTFDIYNGSIWTSTNLVDVDDSLKQGHIKVEGQYTSYTLYGTNTYKANGISFPDGGDLTMNYTSADSNMTFEQNGASYTAVLTTSDLKDYNTTNKTEKAFGTITIYDFDYDLSAKVDSFIANGVYKVIVNDGAGSEQARYLTINGTECKVPDGFGAGWTIEYSNYIYTLDSKYSFEEGDSISFWQGTEDNKIDYAVLKDDSSVITSISWDKLISDSEVEYYNVDYYLKKDSTEIIYTSSKYTSVGEDVTSDVEYKKYVYDFKNNNQKIYFGTLGEDGDIIWTETTTETIPVEFALDETKYLIVGEIGEKSITFLNNNPDEISFNRVEKDAKIETSEKINVNVVKGKTESYTIKTGFDSVEYRNVVVDTADGKTIERVGSWKNINAGEKIEATSIASEDVYDIRYNSTKSQSQSASVSEDGVKVDMMIVADDISINATYTKNELSILGGGYSLRHIASDSSAWFGVMTGKVSDLSIVISNVANSETALFAGSLTANVTNVNLFGGLRKISYKAGNAYAFAKSVGSATISGHSYVFLKGQNGQASGDVTKLTNKISGGTVTYFERKDVLVAGDAVDIYAKTDSSYEISYGKAGSNGGEIEADGNLFTRQGLKGTGVFGVNGTNGKFETVNGKLKGAKDGSKGQAQGTVATQGANPGDRGRKAYTTSNGSGYDGLGGFGRLLIKDKKDYSKTNWYNSSISGSNGVYFYAGESGKDSSLGYGKSVFVTQYRRIDNVGFTAGNSAHNYAGGYKIGLPQGSLSNEDNVYGIYKISNKNAWFENVRKNMLNVLNTPSGEKPQYLTPNNKSKHIFVRLDIKHVSIFTYKVLDQYKLVWTTGENINSVGSVTATGTKIN